MDLLVISTVEECVHLNTVAVIADQESWCFQQHSGSPWTIQQNSTFELVDNSFTLRGRSNCFWRRTARLNVLTQSRLFWTRNTIKLLDIHTASGVPSTCGVTMATVLDVSSGSSIVLVNNTVYCKFNPNAGSTTYENVWISTYVGDVAKPFYDKCSKRTLGGTTGTPGSYGLSRPVSRRTMVGCSECSEMVSCYSPYTQSFDNSPPNCACHCMAAPNISASVTLNRKCFPVVSTPGIPASLNLSAVRASSFSYASDIPLPSPSSSHSLTVTASTPRTPSLSRSQTNSLSSTPTETGIYPTSTQSGTHSKSRLTETISMTGSLSRSATALSTSLSLSKGSASPSISLSASVETTATDTLLGTPSRRTNTPSISQSETDTDSTSATASTVRTPSKSTSETAIPPKVSLVSPNSTLPIEQILAESKRIGSVLNKTVTSVMLLKLSGSTFKNFSAGAAAGGRIDQQSSTGHPGYPLRCVTFYPFLISLQEYLVETPPLLLLRDNRTLAVYFRPALFNTSEDLRTASSKTTIGVVVNRTCQKAHYLQHDLKLEFDVTVATPRSWDSSV